MGSLRLSVGFFTEAYRSCWEGERAISSSLEFRDTRTAGKIRERNYETLKSVPLQAWSGPEGSRKLRFPDFMTTAQDGGKVFQPYAPAAFTPRKCSWYSFLLEAESTQGHSAIGRILCQWKIPMTPTGIKPATSRFVAQHLNHCATAVPPRHWKIVAYLEELNQLFG